MKEDDLREAIWLPIRAYTKLLQGFDTVLTLSLVSITDGVNCGHSLDLSLNTAVSTKLHYQQQETSQWVQLWRRSSIVVSSSRANSPKQAVEFLHGRIG